MKAQRISSLAAAAALALTIGCGQADRSPNSLILATTTSTRDSGLLDLLVPLFREKTGIEVRVVAVGSGQALQLARRGDADVLLTHAPAAEREFMDEGWGEERRPVMHNDFVLVGPGADPAQVKGQTSIAKAFDLIASQLAPFVSRGDESGTHQKELEIWQQTGHEPQGDWHVDAGAGMAESLRMAHEKQAYTLVDRGTFLALRKDLRLEILAESDPLLRNDYAVITVSAKKHSHVKAAAARQFADFLTEPATKKFIAAFGVDKHGEPLFFPTE
jgi:tungstate transport system substrate-binding protein